MNLHAKERKLKKKIRTKTNTNWRQSWIKCDRFVIMNRFDCAVALMSVFDSVSLAIWWNRKERENWKCRHLTKAKNQIINRQPYRRYSHNIRCWVVNKFMPTARFYAHEREKNETRKQHPKYIFIVDTIWNSPFSYHLESITSIFIVKQNEPTWTKHKKCLSFMVPSVSPAGSGNSTGYKNGEFQVVLTIRALYTTLKRNNNYVNSYFVNL